MLGRLARWLRAMGHDVIHDPTIDDDEILRLARDHDRLLLTRDRRLCNRAGPDRCFLVTAPKPAGQLAELRGRLRLFSGPWRDRLFSRCMLCNTTLEPVTFAEVEDRLPPEVRADPRVRAIGFLRCPGCRRVYWEGSHTRRMRRWLDVAARKGIAGAGNE